MKRNLNKLGVVGLFAIMTTAVGYGYHQQQGADIDFDKINSTIAGSLSEILPEYEDVKVFQYSLNSTKSNIDLGKYFIDIEAEYLKTPWGKDPVSVAGTLGFSGPTSDKDQMEFSFSKHTKTDPVALVTYMADKIVCPVPDFLQGVLRVHAENDCDIKESILAVTSVDELYKIIRKHLIDSEESMRLYLQALKSHVQGVKNESVLDLGQDQIKKATALIEAFESVHLAKLKDGFSMDLAELVYNKLLTLKDIHMKVDSTGLSMSATIQTPLGESLYNASKPEIDRFLSALEADEKFARELVKMDARIYLNLVEKILNPETSQKM